MTRPPAASGTRQPRAVLVGRKSLYSLLIERHGTLGQAEFHLRSRGEAIEPYAEAHERVEAALQAVDASLAPDQRRARVDRDDLDRFLFAPDDVVVIVGQDGLVPNVAKYLSGQPVIGINPDPQRYDGVLCTHSPAQASTALRWLQDHEGPFREQQRVMACAVREDGQSLLALNEVFVGHRTHQSARYRIIVRDGEHVRTEDHSSSGVICATGTGATGWARSIAEQRGIKQPLPTPESARLAWFVREPFPSVATTTALNFGFLGARASLRLTSHMSDGGVIFADGIETDRLDFFAGHSVEISVAPHALRLIVAASSPAEDAAPAPALRSRLRP